VQDEREGRGGPFGPGGKILPFRKGGSDGGGPFEASGMRSTTTISKKGGRRGGEKKALEKKLVRSREGSSHREKKKTIPAGFEGEGEGETLNQEEKLSLGKRCGSGGQRPNRKKEAGIRKLFP